MYTYLEDKLPHNIRLVNIHKKYYQVDENDTLFYDFVHTTPQGDEQIAQCYFEEYLMKEVTE